jgi:hypothetical protein
MRTPNTSSTGDWCDGSPRRQKRQAMRREAAEAARLQAEADDLGAAPEDSAELRGGWWRVAGRIGMIAGGIAVAAITITAIVLASGRPNGGAGLVQRSHNKHER